MTESRVLLQPAYILRRQLFRESSLILEAFTPDYGRISLLAKGVRKPKSRSAGLLQPFYPLRLSFTGKSDLKTLTGTELAGAFRPLAGRSLYCGFYLNELITLFLHVGDPHPEVFTAYSGCLGNLEDSENVEGLLRRFEIDLLEKTGYGLDLGFDTRVGLTDTTNKRYDLDANLTPIVAKNGLYSGKTLLAITERRFDSADAVVLAEAKALLRQVFDSMLQGRPLNSRKVLNDITKRL